MHGHHLPLGRDLHIRRRGREELHGVLADAFKCIAALGETGCGFEHQLAAIAVRWASTEGRPPAENQTFLRPDANLAIVMLTNEDDCSASAGRLRSSTPASNTQHRVASSARPRFPPQRIRSLCHGNASEPQRVRTTASPRRSPTDDCPNDAEGYLLWGVTGTASLLKALKTDPDCQVFVGVDPGPGDPVPRGLAAPPPTPPAAPPLPVAGDRALVHREPTASSADPGVRTAQFVQEFGIAGRWFRSARGSLCRRATHRRRKSDSLLVPVVHNGD